MCDISEKYKFMDITVMQAIFYFDAFFSMYKIEEVFHKLVGITSLILSVKMNEN